jgi:hypothetical protein
MIHGVCLLQWKYCETNEYVYSREYTSLLHFMRRRAIRKQ